MTHNIGTVDAPIMVPVRAQGQTVEFLTRAASAEVTEALARQVGLYIEGRVTDPETGEKVGTGEWSLAPGVEMSRVGAITLTPAVLDESGEVVTPAVMDDRDHVNWRLYPPASTNVDLEGNVRWHSWALMWSTQGTAETPNTSEDAVALNGIALIDPDSITTPTRIWA